MSIKRLDIKPRKRMDLQLGLLTSMLEDGTREWREELGKIPKKAVIWQPFPKGHSIGAIILHIADAEAYWIEQVVARKERSPEELALLLSEETDQYVPQWPTPPARPLSYYYEIHDRIRERTRKTLKQLNDPEQIRSRCGKKHTREFTLRWIVHHVITHEAYHGGQAVLLHMQYTRRNQLM